MKMNNFDNVTGEKKQNWPQMLDYPYKIIVIIRSSSSEK